MDPLSPNQLKKKRKESWTPSEKKFWICAGGGLKHVNCLLADTVIYNYDKPYLPENNNKSLIDTSRVNKINTSSCQF